MWRIGKMHLKNHQYIHSFKKIKAGLNYSMKIVKMLLLDWGILQRIPKVSWLVFCSNFQKSRMHSVHQMMQNFRLIILWTLQINQMKRLAKKGRTMSLLSWITQLGSSTWFLVCYTPQQSNVNNKKNIHTCLSFFNRFFAKDRDILAVEEEFSLAVYISVVTRIASSKTWLRGKTWSKSSIAFLRNFDRPGLWERSCILPINDSNLQLCESWFLFTMSDTALRSSRMSSVIVSKLKILSSQLELFVEVLEFKKWWPGH